MTSDDDAAAIFVLRMTVSMPNFSIAKLREGITPAGLAILAHACTKQLCPVCGAKTFSQPTFSEPRGRACESPSCGWYGGYERTVRDDAERFNETPVVVFQKDLNVPSDASFIGLPEPIEPITMTSGNHASAPMSPEN